MPARVYKTNKEQLLAEGKLIVSSADLGTVYLCIEILFKKRPTFF